MRVLALAPLVLLLCVVCIVGSVGVVAADSVGVYSVVVAVATIECVTVMYADVCVCCGVVYDDVDIDVNVVD